MAYLKIKNKKDFISNFLGPISNLNETCILEVKNNKLLSSNRLLILIKLIN
jgi:hypothetical protein